MDQVGGMVVTREQILHRADSQLLGELWVAGKSAWYREVHHSARIVNY